MGTNTEPDRSLDADLFEDVRRIGLGLAVVGILADLSIASVIALIQDRGIFDVPGVLRDAFQVFLTTGPLTVAVAMIAAYPREMLRPYPFWASLVLVAAVFLGHLLGLGINLNNFKADPKLPENFIGTVIWLGRGFVNQYRVFGVLKSCAVGIVVGNRFRLLRERLARARLVESLPVDQGPP